MVLSDGGILRATVDGFPGIPLNGEGRNELGVDDEDWTRGDGKVGEGRV